tara:strand:+ start:336 stop:521 length:186 start_codon:yes stop_codon:yes gene_type:complete
MLFAQFLRIQNKAGGVQASNRQIIKACRSIMSEKGKSFLMREERKKLFKEAIEIQNRCKKH